MSASIMLMRVRTTLNLDDELIRRARELTGVQEKSALIHAGLRELISRGAARRLAALGGTVPKFKTGRWRRAVDVR
jgi:Arc/MetJ family transcription regulator